MKTKLLLIAILICSFCFVHNGYGQQKVAKCGSNKELKTKKDIKEKVVRHAGYVKKATEEQLSAATKAQLQQEYEELQDAFNTLYDKMKADKANLAGAKKICDRYGSELETNVQKAEEYVVKVSKELKFKQAGFGINDLLTLVNLLAEANQQMLDKLFDDLKWPDWTDVKERKF